MGINRVTSPIHLFPPIFGRLIALLDLYRGVQSRATVTGCSHRSQHNSTPSKVVVLTTQHPAPWIVVVVFQSVIAVSDFVFLILPLLLLQYILFATSALLLLLSLFSVIVIFLYSQKKINLLLLLLFLLLLLLPVSEIVVELASPTPQIQIVRQNCCCLILSPVTPMNCAYIAHFAAHSLMVPVNPRHAKVCHQASNLIL